MLNATLGGLIKDFRIKKKLSQMEVSLRLGWKDSTRLSKIEQGHQNITNSELLEKIIEALGLDHFERGQMLEVSQVPVSPEDFELVLVQNKDFLKKIPYPAYICDSTWKSFYMNDLYQKLYKISDSEKNIIEKENWNWLEVMFLLDDFLERVKIKAADDLDVLRDFEEHMIALFKFENGSRGDEKWYKALQTKLSKNSRFRDLWSKIASYGNEHTIFQFEVNTMEGEYNDIFYKLKFMNSVYKFTIDSRLSLIIQYPFDLESIKFCQKNFRK